MELDSIDIKNYLVTRDIFYKDAGIKNVSSGWIGLECPFCDDHSNHLGVSPRGFFNCWRCEEKGSVVKLIKRLEGCDWREAYIIANKFQDPLAVAFNKEEIRAEKVGLPYGVSRNFLPSHIKYLKERGFNPRHITRKYRLLAGGPIGSFRLRLIIPYYLEKRLITFSARDVTGKSDVAYKHLAAKDSILTPKELIYNIDNARKESVVVCEGATDVWKIGDGAVSISGKKATSGQLASLFDKGFKRAFVILDSDAVNQAQTLAYQLSGVIPSVEIIEIEDGDPAELNYKDIESIKKLII